MITVTVNKDSDGICRRICMDGHAGYAEYGQDIVCAATSVLFINTANAIETFTEDAFTVEQDTKSDRVVLQLTSSISDETSLLLNTLLLGLTGIMEEYGDEYIRIQYQ